MQWCESGERFDTNPILLTAANTSHYGYGAIIAPRAKPDDGLLDFCIMEDSGLLKSLWHIRRLFNGTIDRMPGVRIIRTRELRIIRPGPGIFHVDGEPMRGDATLEVAVMPKAIRFALPGTKAP